MPFLRYVRDHRGNENTYLVHTFRRFGKTHPEVLYWFRTPPDVQIGREALDDETMKAVQENFPYVRFDWPKILERKPPQSNSKTDDNSRPPRRQKIRAESKRGRRKKTTEKGTLSAGRNEAALDDEQLGNEGLVSEIKALDSADREDVSPEAISQKVPSGVDQKTSSSRKSSPRRRRRTGWNGLNRKSNSQKNGEPASEIVTKAELQEDAENSKMDAKLMPNETELQGNTKKSATSSPEISEDMETVVRRDKTGSSS